MGKADDILYDQETGEDLVKDGDLVVGDATRQHTQLLIICEKAENKQHPDSGVGIGSWLLDEQDVEDLKREMQSEIEGDGQTIENIVANSIDDISIAGSYGG